MAGQAIFITFLKFSLLYPLNIFDIILSPLCFSLGIIVDLRIDYYNVLCCKKTMHGRIKHLINLPAYAVRRRYAAYVYSCVFNPAYMAPSVKRHLHKRACEMPL